MSIGLTNSTPDAFGVSAVKRVSDGGPAARSGRDSGVPAVARSPGKNNAAEASRAGAFRGVGIRLTAVTLRDKTLHIN